MKKNFWIGVGAVSIMFLSGCGGSKEEAKKEEAAPAPAAAPAAKIDEATAASITGKVLFSGDKPVMRTIDMGAKPECARQHTTPAKSEEVTVNPDGTLKNVFVWVKSGLPNYQWPVPSTPVTIDQHGCMYKPHVLAVMTNQPIEIDNSDPTNHNIHPMPAINREWNESQPPNAGKLQKSFPREEAVPPIPVKCNVHPWMRAYIAVVSHPFFAVTGDDGTFTLKGLPPGEYTIEAWQEKYGKQEMKVTVGPKETKTADFTFKG
jgi:hypothetical protein